MWLLVVMSDTKSINVPTRELNESDEQVVDFFS
jgi:hypothetical protein